MRPANIELHIEELALHGFAPGDRYRIGEAVQRELALLFAQQSLPAWLAQGGELALIDGGSFEMAAGAPAEAIGSHIGQAIYGGINH